MVSVPSSFQSPGPARGPTISPQPVFLALTKSIHISGCVWYSSWQPLPFSLLCGEKWKKITDGQWRTCPAQSVCSPPWFLMNFAALPTLSHLPQQFYPTIFLNYLCIETKSHAHPVVHSFGSTGRHGKGRSGTPCRLDGTPPQTCPG